MTSISYTNPMSMMPDIADVDVNIALLTLLPPIGSRKVIEEVMGVG